MILFVSTCPNSTPKIGGADALWYQAAKKILSSGKEDVAFAYNLCIDERPPALVSLEAAGAKACYYGPYARRYSRKTPFQRIGDKLFHKKNQHLVARYHWLSLLLLKLKPRVICMTLGVAHDVNAFVPELETCQRLGIKVVLISMVEIESFYPSNQVRDLMRKGFSLADKTVFVSQRGVENVSHQLAMDLNHVHILQNPVNTSGDVLPWPDVKTSGIRFASVGRYDLGHKGQDKLLAALSRVSWRDQLWTFDLYGWGIGETYLAELIRYYRLEGKVFLKGPAASADDVWKNHQVFLLTSNLEGTPLAVIEALRAGRPVLATDVGGCAEWIQDGISGWIADAPTIRSIHGALERVWTDHNRWKNMGDAARARAVELCEEEPWDRLIQLLSDC